MTLNTIVKVPNTLFLMLPQNVRRGMFVTAVAGVSAVVVVCVAGHAGSVMVFIEQEKLVVIESSRFPLLWCVALGAITADLPMKRVHGALVARFASIPRFRAQKRMRERFANPLSQPWSLMVAMASRAVLLEQILMKGGLPSRFGNRDAFGGSKADVWKGVAGDAPLGRDASQGGMACKTVCVDVRMGLDQWARCHHEVGIGKNQTYHYHKVGCNDGQNPAAFHFQPQNKNMAMIWASARTANASVMGK